MFIGHFALAFAAKRAAPAVSLGTLFLSCQLADLIWPNLVLAGVEHFEVVPGITATTPLDFQSYPYSHSLVALAGWAALTAGIYKVVRRTPATAALVVIASLVLSHWLLDFVTHRPDMPLTIGGTEKYGLGLWNSWTGTLVIEMLMLGAGVALYARSTTPIDRTGNLGLYGLVAFLLVINTANMFGPPPPSVSAVTWSIQAMWLIVAWGYWIDRHRQRR